MTRPFWARALLVSSLLLALGCGSRGSVTGTVTYRGKSMPGGMVLFIHEHKGAFSAAIKEDGTYQIADIPGGSVKIAVTVPAFRPATGGSHYVPTEEELEKLQKSHPRLSKEDLKQMMGVRSATPRGKALQIPEKYGNPEESGLTYTVIGGPQTHDINLD
jgi:hypothetical protein